MPGITAWVGIEKIGNAKEGSNVYISAAAGGVGIIAGQLAKVKGCRVVGSVGSDHKVQICRSVHFYLSIVLKINIQIILDCYFLFVGEVVERRVWV